MVGKTLKTTSKYLMVVSLSLLTTAASADLEWVTGGVPKNTVESSASTSVQDAPGASTAPGTNGTQEILVGHLTTSTRIAGQYPIDSVNFFFLGKHTQVAYFAYFLAKPSSRIHTALVECYSPSGLRIARFEREYKVSFVDNLLTVKNETYQWFLLDMTLGLDRLHPESGQSGLPKEVGLYSVHLTVDGQLVGITFFYVKNAEAQTAPAVPTALPAGKTAPLSMPMSTPVSTAPLRKTQ